MQTLAQRCVAVIHRTLTAKAQHGDLEELGHGFTGYAAKALDAPLQGRSGGW